MFLGHWPTYLVIAGLVSVGLSCLIGLNQPLQAPDMASAAGARSQARYAPAALKNAVDPQETVNAVTARLPTRSGS